MSCIKILQQMFKAILILIFSGFSEIACVLQVSKLHTFLKESRVVLRSIIVPI